MMKASLPVFEQLLNADRLGFMGVRPAPFEMGFTVNAIVVCVSGEYKFDRADLSVYHGIAGMLSSPCRDSSKPTAS
jgi:hypothetical protein